MLYAILITLDHIAIAQPETGAQCVVCWVYLLCCFVIVLCNIVSVIPYYDVIDIVHVIYLHGCTHMYAHIGC